MRVPALREVGVYGPRAVSTWICANDCVRVHVCVCVEACVLGVQVHADIQYVCVSAHAQCVIPVVSLLGDKRKKRGQGSSQFITVPTFVMPLNTPSMRPSQIY